jgi:hypothetical protein
LLYILSPAMLLPSFKLNYLVHYIPNKKRQTRKPYFLYLTNYQA